MKYFKTQNLYKASNVAFNPSTVSAHSYGWWEFVKIIQGKVVFNAFRYSNSTAKHQYKVRSVMNELGITIDFVANVKSSLGSYEDSFKSLVRDSKQTTEQTEKTKADNKKRSRIKVQIRKLNEQGLYSQKQLDLIKQGMHPESTIYHAAVDAMKGA